MTIAFVNAGYANPSPSTSAQTTAQSVTAGNALFVFVGWGSSGVSVTSVTDIAGNTFTPLTQQASSTFAFGQLFYCLNVLGNASNRVTVTLSGSSTIRVYCAQYSGVATSAAYDEEANTGVVGTTATAGSVSVPDDGVLFAGAFFRDDRAPTWDGAFTLRGDISNITIADQIVTTGLSDQAALTWTTSAYVVLCSAVFLAAGSGPTPPNPPTGVSATSVTRTTATANWTDASSDEDDFDVEIAASPYSSWSAVAGSPVAANSTSVAVTGLTEGTSYKFRVRAANAGGDSAWAESDAWTTLTRRLKILNIDASSIGETSVAGVVWAAPSGADIVGAKIAEFTGKTIADVGGEGALYIPVSEIGGTLVPGDSPRVYLRGATEDTPIFTASVADET